MKHEIRVDPEHFAYLRLQKGSLDEFTHHFPEWHRRYVADLQETFDQVAPWLPKSCEAVLDVGSGLGGIDALIAAHYRAQGREPHVSLLDGIDDEPVMVQHRRTFNSMRVAKDFLVKNGLDPLRFGSYSPEAPRFDRQYDLVVSFGSWAFHYPPWWYLDRIAATALHPSTVVILDVRRHKLDWMGDLERVLELVTMVKYKPKWSRCVFKVRPT
jgi:SAM-dependent methyltransferase